MNESVCAYCKKPGVFTKEHLWPASLHGRIVRANKQTTTNIWTARTEKDLPSEPTIRDVCQSCNNGVLSTLDSYICELFDTTFIHIPERFERVTFEYDYHLLKRWLLKMAFNSARMHQSADMEALEKMSPYMLGTNHKLGRFVDVFVQLSYPEEIPPEEIVSLGLPDHTSRIFLPDHNRVGFFLYREHGVGQKLLRAVHLRSFSFYLAYADPSGNLEIQYDFIRHITKMMPTVVRLLPTISKVELLCDGIGAWASIQGARNTKLEFDDDT